EGTQQARQIDGLRDNLTNSWLANQRIRDQFLSVLRENGGNVKHPIANRAAWEASVEKLKACFNSRRDLGIRKTDLYRVVPTDSIANENDFRFSWKLRK